MLILKGIMALIALSAIAIILLIIFIANLIALFDKKKTKIERFIGLMWVMGLPAYVITLIL